MPHNGKKEVQQTHFDHLMIKHQHKPNYMTISDLTITSNEISKKHLQMFERQVILGQDRSQTMKWSDNAHSSRGTKVSIYSTILSQKTPRRKHENIEPEVETKIR